MISGDCRNGLRNRSGVALAALSCVVAATVGLHAPAGADVPKLSESGAYGYFSRVSLFGGPANNSGPAPTVTLPAQGSRTPVTAVVPSAKAQYGPAAILESGEQRVSTEGTPGPNGSTTSSASARGIRDAPLPLLYETVSSTCTARGSELTGSTSLAGQLAISTFAAPDPREGDPKDVVPMPANPAPNTERTGELNNIGDRFRVVFNEQIREGGVLTVNAVHMYLLGPIAIGDLIIAQSRCAVGAAAAPGGTTPGPSTPPETAPPTTVTAAAAAPPAREASASSDGSSTNVVPVALGASVVLASGGVLFLRRRKSHPFGNGGR